MILNGNNITKEYTRRGEKFPAVNNAENPEAARARF